MLVKLQKRMKTLQDRISSTYIEEASISELPDVVTAADMFEESIGCLQERVDYWRRWILLYKDRINIQINLVCRLPAKIVTLTCLTHSRMYLIHRCIN